MLFVLHIIICMALIAASLWSGKSTSLPFIVAAGVVGVFLSYRSGIELFIAWYSGVHPDDQDPRRSLLAWSSVVLPLAPFVALLPGFRERPVLVSLIVSLAVIPSLGRLAIR
jgi:UPF0716 family protein affecting phage T7 exclusion